MTEDIGEKTGRRDTGWENSLTAELYSKFAQEYPMYRQTSRDLVELADLREGMTVVDLACGAGTTTQEILHRIGASGSVFAIDLSPSMIAQARQQISDPNIVFIQSPAEDLDKAVSDPVDAVISNSAIWQMDLPRVFKTVRKVLKPGGRFAFNIQGQFFRFPTPDPKSTFIISLPILMYAVAQSRYGQKDTGYRMQQKIDTEAVMKTAEEAQFSLAANKEITYERTAQEAYDFERIPVMTEKLLPGLGYKTRMEILDLAYAQLDKTIRYPNRWVFFLFQKSQT